MSNAIAAAMSAAPCVAPTQGYQVFDLPQAFAGAAASRCWTPALRCVRASAGRCHARFRETTNIHSSHPSAGALKDFMGHCRCITFVAAISGAPALPSAAEQAKQSVVYWSATAGCTRPTLSHTRHTSCFWRLTSVCRSGLASSSAVQRSLFPSASYRWMRFCLRPATRVKLSKTGLYRCTAQRHHVVRRSALSPALRLVPLHALPFAACVIQPKWWMLVFRRTVRPGVSFCLLARTRLPSASATLLIACPQHGNAQEQSVLCAIAIDLSSRTNPCTTADRPQHAHLAAALPDRRPPCQKRPASRDPPHQPMAAPPPPAGCLCQPMRRPAPPCPVTANHPDHDQ